MLVIPDSVARRLIFLDRHLAGHQRETTVIRDIFQGELDGSRHPCSSTRTLLAALKGLMRETWDLGVVSEGSKICHIVCLAELDSNSKPPAAPTSVTIEHGYWLNAPPALYLKIKDNRLE
jgi:hypothetical protein